MADELGCDTKTIDNALQRVKRKILAHQSCVNPPAPRETKGAGGNAAYHGYAPE